MELLRWRAERLKGVAFFFTLGELNNRGSSEVNALIYSFELRANIGHVAL
jgi:hypothetical protein